jgi:hypothetical protein
MLALSLLAGSAHATATLTLGSVDQRYVRASTAVWVGSNQQQGGEQLNANRSLDWTRTATGVTQIGQSRASASAFHSTRAESTRISGFGNVTASARNVGADLSTAAAFSEHIATFVASEPFTFLLTGQMTTASGGAGLIQIENLADRSSGYYLEIPSDRTEVMNIGRTFPAGEFLLRISTNVQYSASSPTDVSRSNAFDYVFQIIPAPGTAAALMGGLALVTRRQRAK